MKSKVIGTSVSFVVILISCIVVVFSAFVDGITASIMLNLGIGILGSGIVSFVMTFSEYFVEKRFAQENYYNASIKIVNELHSITYVSIGEESKLIAAYDRECQFNETFKMLRINSEAERYEQLCEFYKNNTEWLNGVSDDLKKIIIKTRIEKIKKCVEEGMNSYLKVSSISLGELESAYGKLYFITDIFKIKHAKARSKIYLSIHKPIREICKIIKQENYHFNIYLSSQEKNMPIVVEKLDFCNKHLFLVERKNAKECVVWARWCDEQYEVLEKFRCDMNKDKYAELERSPIQYSINGISQE